MSYLSKKKNNLSTFFCKDCDKLMNQGAYKELNSDKILCKDCFNKISLEREFVERKEGHEEISQCLKLIENTIRVTRRDEDFISLENQHEIECQTCEEDKKKKADIYCINDEAAFCNECFEKEHQKEFLKKHTTIEIKEMLLNDKEKLLFSISSFSSSLSSSENFCSKHKLVEPIYCIDDKKMFCSICSINDHANHRMIGIDAKSKEEKQRVNLETYLNLLNERSHEFQNIEKELTNFVIIFEETIKKTNEMINETKKTNGNLRETIELWKQIDCEIDVKEWCKEEFVNSVKSKVETVEEKWREREREMRDKIKEMINGIENSFKYLLDPFLSKEEKEKRDNSTKELIIRESIESEIFEREKVEKERIEKERIEREIHKKIRIEREKQQRQRHERELLERLRIEREKLEKEIIEKEKIERERIERERIEKDQWKSSSLLSNDNDIQFLNHCLKENKLNITIKAIKLFQASQHSFSSQQFHSHCDDRGKTIVIVQSTNGRLFGGFANVSWHSRNGFSKDEEGKSFLFSIDEKKKYTLKNSNFAICGYLGCGPLFGGSTFSNVIIGGFDLGIYDHCNLNSHSRSKPKSYSISSNTILAGTHYFQVKEYEVWTIEKLNGV